MSTADTQRKPSGSRIAAYRERYAPAAGAVPKPGPPPVQARAPVADAAPATRADGAELVRAATALVEASHRLRTPVNAISGFAAMLADAERYCIDADRLREYAGYIAVSADILTRQFDVLFQTASFDAGTVSGARVRLDLGASLLAAARRVEPAAAAAKVAIENRTRPESVWGLGDADCLSAALDHLLRAGVERSEPSAQVLLRAETIGCVVVVGMRDFGPHIGEDAIAAAATVAMDPSAGPARMLRGEGGGPAGAFALAGRLAESQGGRLEIRSREGKGLIARLELPAAATDQGTE